MADNYLEFSEEITGLTENEKQWWLDQFEPVYVFGDKEYTEANLPAQCDTAKADWYGCRGYRDMPDCESSPFAQVGFAYVFIEAPAEDDVDSGRCLHIYSQDWGSLDGVAHLVQKFLKKFRPKECWSLTWAETCSKPRIGNFGGGWMFVTAEKVEWGDTFSQAEALWKASQQQDAEEEKDTACVHVLYDFDMRELASTTVYPDSEAAANDAAGLDNVMVLSLEVPA
ncbi:MAG: hypothetical protein GXY83_19625 [Rhodopirellula sp.]|nr:hypothetical protein [Rhodopirellula sp.]